MVACTADDLSSTHIISPRHSEARPVNMKPSSSSSVASNLSFPFRLSGDHPRAVERAASIVSSDQQSIYKQRIDSMFEETRSTTYGPSNNRRANFVQAKIEQMFQEIASSSEEDTRNTQQTSIDSSNFDENQYFNVHYLGNVPLNDKDTTLLNLQSPLKLLYFKYRELEVKNLKPALSKLQISSNGLRVIQGTRSELNPFSTIAVWAAVKCVSRLEGKKLAFLPLIADPDGQDKSSLFSDLNSENEINLANGLHSPLLAVVMRQHGASKQLTCHVYVCSCSEDAIVMAANLYQALMASMKSKLVQTQQKIVDKPVRPPRKAKSKTSSEDDEILPEPDTKVYLTHKRQMSTSHRIKDPSGDILTKVAIPRSRSFLMKHATRGNSLHQLFAEIRSQEGVTNMDDVLEKIVNANGMSFNDLKPLYKELLLKLAVTLTRDELYLRSKNIMKRQIKSTKRSRKRKTGFKYVFRKSVKKIHGKVSCNKQPSTFEFTSILFPTKNCVGPRTSSSTCSSYRKLQRKSGLKDRARKHKEAVDSRLSNIANRELRRSSITKDSKKNDAQAKRESSSGYVSCSECSMTSCMCDTDSCAETDKCYCSLNKKQVVTSTSWRHHLNKPPSTHTSRSLQLLLQQPIASTTKRRPSSYTSRMDVYDELPPARRNSVSISHRSINNTINSAPKFSSVDNLALDYELFRYNSQQNSTVYSQSQQRVLVVSARDNRGRLIYVGAAEKDKRKIYRDPATEALAVKKSAEIASLFSDMKLSQTTDIRGIEFEDDGGDGEVEYNTLEPPEHPSLQNRRGSYPGSSLENSLGYLP